MIRREEDPTVIRVRQGFDEDRAELSVPKSELDGLHDSHREDVLGLMSRFALGRLDDEDLAFLFTVEGMSLHMPADNDSGPVDMTNILGEIVLVGAPQDVAQLQG